MKVSIKCIITQLPDALSEVALLGFEIETVREISDKALSNGIYAALVGDAQHVSEGAVHAFSFQKK